ncbi:MAG: Ku protein [Pseudomonadota bacterium]|nr:Ku protein [Pseudomonadota bacterium]
MPARAYWKGYLRLSLVSIGIELYSAVASGAKPSLRQIDRKSGKRIRYQKIAPGEGPVDTDDIIKGYQLGKDEYVLLDPEDLDAIKLESKSTIDLVQFVDFCEIDPRYFEKPYYIAPNDDEVASEGFAVIRDALRQAKKVGLGQMASRGRDHLVAVKPCGDGLLLETLRYANEIKASDRIFDDIPEIKVDKEMLSLAGELIERKSAPFKPESFKSQYAAALKELIAEKQKKGGVSVADEELPQNGNVIDLMEALKKSVAKGGRAKKSPSRAAKRRSPAKKTKRKAG